MKERIRRFMAGRYGIDELSKLCTGVSLIIMMISVFTRWTIFYVLGLALLLYAYWRAFSKNVAKRYEENQKYRSWRYQQVVKWEQWKKQREGRKIYRYYNCPQCKQKVRVPKGKGKICITCPKCRKEFVKRT